jgi:parallel beta-helix repeat protein
MRALRALPALMLLLLSVVPSMLPVATAQSFDAPIAATGDAALRALATARGFPGSGTASDPYVVAGLNISSNQRHGIELRDTTLAVVIRDLSVVSTNGANDGIRLVGVTGVTIASAYLEGNRMGVAVERSSGVAVRGVTVVASSEGVLVASSSGLTVADNAVHVSDRAFHLRDSTDNTLERNRVSIASGQTGFHFADARSYANRVAATNTVNDAAVRWYAAPCPERIEGVEARLAGITNVAQIMLHECVGTVVEGARAADSPLPGILVNGGSDVSIRNATSERTSIGIEARATPRLRIEDSRLERNGVGIRLTGGPGATVTRTLVADSSSDGVRAQDVAGLVLVSNTLTRNTDGVHLNGATGANVTANTLDANRGAGLKLARTSGATVEGNRFAGDSPSIMLDDSVDNRFLANDLAPRAGGYGFHFRDETSYRNVLGPDNLVGGDPLRWYSRIAGDAEAPLVIEDVSVATPGATNVAQIFVDGARHVVLRNVTASNGLTTGLFVRGSDNVTLRDIDASGNGGHGLRIEQSTAVRATNVTAEGNRQSGIRAEQSSGLRIEDARIDRNLRAGLSFERVRDTNASSLSLDGNTRGVELTDVTGLRLVDALVSNTSREGFTLTRSSANVIANVTVQGGKAAGMRLLEGSRGNVVADSIVADNGAIGISFDDGAGNNVLYGNVVRGQRYAIQLGKAAANELMGNTLEAPADGYGLRFTDEASHDTTVHANNTANGARIHWYARNAGTPERPLRLDGIVADTPGATNVGQVVLYRVSHVVVANATAKGDVAGIVVLRSANVTVQDSRAEGKEHGILVSGTLHSRLLRNDVSGSTTGVRLESSSQVLVTGTQAARTRTAIQLEKDTRHNEIVDNHPGGAYLGIRRKSVEDLTAPAPNQPGLNLVVDAGLDRESAPGTEVKFTTVMVSSPTDPVVRQEWSYGDGENETFEGSAPSRPGHLYRTEGNLVATLSVHLASGRVVTDSVNLTIELPLSAPRALDAREKAGAIALTWSPPAGVRGVEYRLYRGEDEKSMTILGDALTRLDFEDETTEAGKPYHYAVSAVRRGVEGPRSDTVVASQGEIPEEKFLILGLTPTVWGIALGLVLALVAVVVLVRRRKEVDTVE